MRKLDKSVILSSKYKQWEEQVEWGKHPKYNTQSVKNKYYIDIVMNLLHIQQGVCAYTEISLCDPHKLIQDNWQDGKYRTTSKSVSNICKGGELDHFNSTFKNGNSWLWDNFFFIDSDVNRRKSNLEIDNILKPDSPDYDENKYLEYDTDHHVFIANSDLPEDIQIRVENMIKILGMNSVAYQRKIYLSEKIFDLKYSGKSVVVDCFFTAFEMCKKQLW